MHNKFCDFFGTVFDSDESLWSLDRDMPEHFYYDSLVGEDKEFFEKYRSPYLYRIISTNTINARTIEEKYSIKLSSISTRHDAIANFHIIDINGIKYQRVLKIETNKLIKRYSSEIVEHDYSFYRIEGLFKLGYCCSELIGDTEEFYKKYRNHIGKTVSVNKNNVSLIEEKYKVKLNKIEDIDILSKICQYFK